MIAVTANVVLASAHSVEPDAILALPVEADGGRQCGLQADYTISGAVLRVELLASANDNGAAIKIRAYAPNSVGPMLRDLWLKTPTLCKRCVAPTLTDQAGIFAWAQGIRSSMRD